MSQLDNWINSELEAEFREVQKIKPLEFLVGALLEKITDGKEGADKEAALQDIFNRALEENFDSNQINYIKAILNK